ncbi:MAG: PEGA domain-containing protein [Sandaracinus sp.]|nr:PEGA domain-containing protein [Sandaracinus sp.]
MVLAVDPAEATLAEGLGELLLAHMAHDGVRMVGKEEIQAALGHDDAGSLGCLATPSCLGQLATQLGLEELVAVTFARRGEGFSFDLARFELRSGERRADVHREVAAAEVGSLAEAMVAALETSTEAPTPRPARLTLAVEPSNAHVVLDGVAVEVDGPLSVTAGTHRLRVEAEGYVAVERTLELDEGERRDVDVALACGAAAFSTLRSAARDANDRILSVRSRGWRAASRWCPPASRSRSGCVRSARSRRA